jgi:amino acid adenylation domain-containing protein/non-ribosomal peptide synthase protein (TIGR01720 family)/FkbM family methyltransferase
MKEVVELILELADLNIDIYLEEGKLKIDFPDEAPLDAILPKIKSHKEKLIEYLSVHKNSTLAEIPKAETADSYPLSSSQRRLWLLCQLEESNIAYNIPRAYVFDGDLSRDGLAYAFNALIERHEIFRTVFAENDKGEIRQFIRFPEEIKFRISWNDLRSDPSGNEKAATLVRQESGTAFDLSIGPLIRASVIQVEDNKWIFVYVLHHIVSDGWSTGILMKELLLFYEAYTSGNRHSLPDLRIQYKDYAVWQQQQLGGGDFREHRKYWLQQFGGEWPVLDLPVDKTRPAVRTYSGGTIKKRINASVSKDIKALSRQQGVTLFMTLVAAVNVLLSRYTNQEDIILGSTIAGREYANLEDQIGFYINILPLRIRFDKDDTFRILLENIRQLTLKSYEHQAYPFDELIDVLDLKRTRGRNALFDVFVDFQDSGIVHSMKGRQDELRISQYKGGEQAVAKFDLTIMFGEFDGEIQIEIEYSSDLFESERVERIGRHLEEILKSTAKNIDTPVSKLNFLDEGERNALLVTFNDTISNPSGYVSVVDLFRIQAAKTPDAIAVLYGKSTLSYKQLDEASDSMASYLLSTCDVHTDDLVGILMGRSEKMIIAILGILKSGAAYVPVDPDYPGTRKQYIIEDTAMKVLITEMDYLFELEYYTGNIIAMDVQLDILETVEKPRETDIRPGDPVYVIYTSGSTGQPKGCIITHGNLSNYIQWAVNYYFSALDSIDFCFFTSLSFDLTVTSLFCPLISGGKISIYGQQEDPSKILEHAFGSNDGINCIKLTPSHVNILEHSPIRSSSILFAILGGEEVNPRQVGILRKISPSIRVFNEYGPTETTVGCIVKELEEDKPIVIGRPISGTAIYILDKYGTPSPIGIPGEICITGKGVARGYLNKPELTNQKFVPNAFRHGDSIYKTGDLGKWLPSGDIEFLGRMDDQVKIRGYRIELGEIASAMMRHKDIGEAVVLAKKDKEGNTSLVAYYVPAMEKPVDARSTLPEGARLHKVSEDYDFYAYNKTELEFVYKEVFVEECYLDHGMVIPENGCIVDVGANMGIFSVFAGMQAKSVKIYSFEPLPPTFELLKLNTSLYDGDYHIFNIGLSDKEETVTFSYFPNATVLSGRYVENDEITSIVKNTILNRETEARDMLTEEDMSELLTDRLVTQKYACKLKTLTQIIEENHIDRIDYLKIDVEKSEMDVLNGIAGKDWSKIRQIAIEVHDVGGRLDQICGLLESHGFVIGFKQNAYLENTGLYDVYAISRETLARPYRKAEKNKKAQIRTPELVSDIKEFLLNELPAYMIPSQVVALDSFPLTANGKIDKKNLPDPEEAGSASVKEYIAPGTEIERELISACKQVLKKERIGLQDDFFTLGGDSIKSIQIVSRLRQSGYVITIQDIMRYPLISDMAGRVGIISRVIEQGPVIGQIPLSPVQTWYFQSRYGTRHHYNQSVLLSSGEPLSQAGLKAVLNKIMSHHDALRMVFRRDADEWIQINQGEELRCELEVIALTNEIGFRDHCDRIQAGLNLENGPLFKAALFRDMTASSPRPDRLLLVIHHLVMDAVSWRILLEDLSVLYDKYKSGMSLDLPLKTDSFRYWQSRQVEYAGSAELQKERTYWDLVEAACCDASPLPADNFKGSNLIKDINQCSFWLDEAMTGKLLTQCHNAYGTGINDILLTALGMSFAEVFGIWKVPVRLEGHGREYLGTDTDISRTVGWFTILYPVLLDMSYAEDMSRQLIEVKECLHRVPNKGIGYGILRYSGGAEYTFDPAVNFNYLGDFGTGVEQTGTDTIFAFSGDYQGTTIAMDKPRDSMLDISGIVAGNRLKCSVEFSREQYSPDKVERLAQSFKRKLEELIDRLSVERTVQLTPVDLTYDRLSIPQVLELNRNGTLEDVYPLSPLQEGLYYHWSSSSESAVYFEQTSYRLKGELNIGVLQRSYEALVSRHAILRTRFSADLGDVILQVVDKDGPPVFRYRDISGETDEVLEKYKEADRGEGFDLHHGPPVRLSVLRLNNDTHEFIWSHHHILMDGWCAGVLIREFFQLYDNLIQGTHPVLKRIYPYAGYIAWLGKRDKEISLQYWHKYLEGYDTASGVPTLSTVTRQGWQAAKNSFTLTGETRRSIRSLCMALGVTEHTLMQTTWGILLGKYNDCRDVVFGSVVSGRPGELEGVEEMIGLFVNTIPVRIGSVKGMKATDLLRQVQQASIESTGHHYVQLAEVQAESQLGGHLFDHLLIFENYPVQELVKQEMNGRGGSADLSLVSSEGIWQTNYDLSVMIIPRDDIQVEVTYNRLRYDAAQMERLLEHWQRIIGHILERPDSIIDEIDYIGEQEKYELLSIFNDTAVNYPKDKTIAALFEEQALKTPEHTGLVFDDRQLTYRELNEQANRFGHYLRLQYSIQPDDPVGIRLQRGEQAVLAILAVLKAGGACVPVNPDHPAERNEYILTQSRCKVVIDAEEVDKFNACRHDYPIDNLPHTANAADLAYVIYTSGSTGRPKGCMLENRGIINHLCSKINLLKLQAGETLCHSSELYFVGGIWQLWTPLITGGAVILCNREELTSLDKLLHRTREVNSRILEIMPSQLNEYLTYEGEIRMPGIRTLILTGERLTPAVIDRCYKGNEELEIINTYGQTESSDVTVFYRIPRGQTNTAAGAEGKVLIGKPIQNMHQYILSAGGMLSPVGVTGEICTAGDGICRGYIDQAKLTAERFAPDPFDGSHRMYRTGDLGRWLPDGNLEILGRKDDQVKIRGFRVETAEIENALLRLGGITEARVLAEGKSGDEVILTAYLVSSDGIAVDELRRQLAGRIPDYMIPQKYLQVDKIPVLENGKTDKKALRAIEEEEMPAGTVYAAPRNKIEDWLVPVWEKLLQRDRIGIDDNFFQLGGHSLKATRLVSMIRKELGIDIKIPDIFMRSTIRELAGLIAESSTYEHRPILPVAQAPHYPLSSAQHLFWISCQIEEGNTAYNMPAVYVFEGDLDNAALSYAFAGVIERHEILRTVFLEDEKDEVRQYLLSPAELDFKIACRDLRNEKDPQKVLKELVRAEFIKPFDLSAGPLIRASLFRVGETRWTFTNVMHHIIGDGWSMNILITELLMFYEAYRSSKAHPLPALRIQYKDYAIWQLEQLKKETAWKHKAYWLKQFEGELPILDLADEYARPALKTYRGGLVAMTVDATTGARFKTLLQQQDCTLFMGLVALVNTLVWLYTGHEDIIIGTSIAGREHVDLEDQIGYYLNTLALRTRFKGSHGFLDVLKRVKQVTLESYEHQSYPFSELVSALQLKRDISRNNLFDIFILLQNERERDAGPAQRIPGDIRLENYKEVEYPVSKFDLSFIFLENKDRLSATFEYNTDLFSRKKVEKIADHLGQLMSLVVDQSSTDIGDLGKHFLKTDLTALTSGKISSFSTSISSEF